MIEIKHRLTGEILFRLKKNTNATINLKGLDFSNRTINQANFDFMQMCGSDFHHSDLRGCTFEYCDLRGCNFEFCDLRGCDFRNSILVDASLKFAHVHWAEFQGSRMKNCNVEGVDFKQAELNRGQRRRIKEFLEKMR